MYLFDSHSRDERGLPVADGKSVFPKICRNLNHILKLSIWSNKTKNMHYFNFYISILKKKLRVRKSVLKFFIEKYNILVDIYCNTVPSFDGSLYICITCDRTFKKKKIPCQSVSNKLEVHHLPEHFTNVRKLEKVLIAKREFFLRKSP